jgi:hypothetical protein
MRLTLFLLLSLTTTFAAEKNYNFRADFSLGRYIDGPRVNAAMQKDKGTLLFFWAYEIESGTNLKIFQKFADEHKEDLVVIGVENIGYSGSPKNITSLLKKCGVTYSCYSGCRGPIKTNIYPYACAFDREGKMVYSGMGSSEEIAEAIVKAVAKPEKKDDKKDGKDEPKKSEKPKVDPKKAA